MSLSLRNVTLDRGKARVLTDVSFEVVPGELMVLIGPNGAGKSTALNLLAGSLHPTSGEALYGNRSVHSVPIEEMARNRAVMSQSYDLVFPFMAREVVELGRLPWESAYSAAEHQAAVEDAIRTVDAWPLKDRLYPTLSGGEKQRIQLARTLAQAGGDRRTEDAGFLLLDEPTASLDLSHQHDILAIAKACAESGAGVLAVLHDLNLAAQYADRVILMQDGRKVAEGAPEEVLTPEILMPVFEISISILRHPETGARIIVPSHESRRKLH